MSPKVIVTGATGLLGRQVVRQFEQAGWEVIGTGYSRASPPKMLKVDVQDEAQLKKVLDDQQPQVVVHCAANRQPDSCTNDPDGARRLNVEATRTLANLTTSRSILLIYISTDYVFPGRRGEAPYAATAEPSPPNIYGQTKLDGEAAVLKVTKKMGTQHLGVILRVPVLYGKVEPEGNNKESAINVLMDGLWKSQDKVDAEAAQKIKMDHYAQRFPTNTEDVGKVLVQIAQKYTSSKAKEQGLPQILQFSSEDQMTKFEICEVFAEIMGLSMDGIVKDIPKDDPSAGGTVRPYDCHLSTKELKDIGMDVSTMDFKAWWRREVGAFRH